MPPKKEKKPLFEPKSMVLAKMTGFPAWPLFVMPLDMIPPAILAAKKKTTNLCVIFIPDGDYNWMNEKLLEALSPEKLQAKLSKFPKDKLKAKPKKKTGRTNNVAEALLAATGLVFDKFMDELTRQNKASTQRNEDDDDEDEAEDEVDESDDEEGEEDSATIKTDKTDDVDEEQEDESLEDSGMDGSSSVDTSVRRSRRKDAIAHSTLDEDEIEDDEVDQEDTNGNENEDSDSNTRKRMRSLRTNGGTRKKVSPSNGNGKAKNGHEVKVEARSSSPKPLTEKDRQHQLWLCRIKLQRSLIQRNQPATPKDPKQYPPPTVDELLVARIILHRLADFPVSVELLRETKIHKVLKCILKDEDLEYPDSFQLHEKCEQLLDKWKDMIESLKLEKQARYDSRLSSQVPEDSEISGIETKRSLEGEQAKKLKV